MQVACIINKAIIISIVASVIIIIVVIIIIIIIIIIVVVVDDDDGLYIGSVVDISRDDEGVGAVEAHVVVRGDFCGVEN